MSLLGAGAEFTALKAMSAIEALVLGEPAACERLAAHEGAAAALLALAARVEARCGGAAGAGGGRVCAAVPASPGCCWGLRRRAGELR